MKEALQDLIDISRYAARHPDFVQGGGGNCSVKFAGDRMAIKASGVFLEDVNASGGFVILELPSERKINETALVPSLETPLHSLLGKFVIHTHPVIAGPLLCSQEGSHAFRGLFPEPFFHWIGYANPGPELREKVQSFVESSGVSLQSDCVLFLENHGIFVSSPAKQRSMELHDTIVSRLEAFFKLQETAEAETEPVRLKGYLTPDHVVYGHLDRSRLAPRQQTAVTELDVMTREITRITAAKGWTPQFLSEKDAAHILGMDQEKYRQEILKKLP